MALEVEQKLPKITKDGVTIVKSIMRRDALEEVCCAILRQSAHNTNEYCGDGTTTSTILACSLFKKGQRLLAAGGNPIRIKKGIEMARDHLIEFLDEIKVPAGDIGSLKNCAMVATNYDEGLSTLIADALHSKGLKGVIHMEPVPTPETSLAVRWVHIVHRGRRTWKRHCLDRHAEEHEEQDVREGSNKTRVQIAEGVGGRL